jgi:hypothetical protein
MLSEAFFKLRSVITEHTFKLFNTRKNQLMHQRLCFFKKQNWQLYEAKITEASQNFFNISGLEMRYALEVLEMTEANYMVAL